VTPEKHLLFLCFDLLCRFFWIFFSFSTPVVVVNFIGIMKSKFLSFLFFSVTFFIAAINLCLYVGLLQFCGVFLFYLSLFFNFYFFKPIIIFFYIYSFVFPIVLFPLQLIFNVCKSSLSTST